MCLASQPEWVSLLSPHGPPCGRLGLGFLTPWWSQDNQTRYFVLWQTSGFQSKTQTDTVPLLPHSFGESKSQTSLDSWGGEVASTASGEEKQQTHRHSGGRGGEWGHLWRLSPIISCIFSGSIGLLFSPAGILWCKNTSQAGNSPIVLNIRSFTSNSRVLWKGIAVSSLTVGLSIRGFTDCLGKDNNGQHQLSTCYGPNLCLCLFHIWRYHHNLPRSIPIISMAVPGLVQVVAWHSWYRRFKNASHTRDHHPFPSPEALISLRYLLWWLVSFT